MSPRRRLPSCDGAAPSQVIANTARAPSAVFLRDCAADFAVCEPTGGHETICCSKNASAPSSPATAPIRASSRPSSARVGRLGKSDAIDARATGRLWPRALGGALSCGMRPDAEQETQLKALVRRRADLVALRVAEKQPSRGRAQGSWPPPSGPSLAVPERQIERSIRRSAALMRSGPQAHVPHRRRHRHDGHRPNHRRRLFAAMPELGTLERSQAAALAGLAPHPNEADIKRTVVPTTAAAGRRPNHPLHARHAGGRRPGEFAAFYKRLVDAGKKPILALAAVMRKIVVTLNARLRDAQIQQS